MQIPFGGKVIGHCLLLKDKNGYALVDTGIGLLETKNPGERIGQFIIDKEGMQFDEDQTAVRQIERYGIKPDDIKHCIVTHLDPDHIGGLADFPDLEVHVSKEEYDNFKRGNFRYIQKQLEHNPKVTTYKTSKVKWFGLEARKVHLDFESDIYLIPLFGHTLGHCGVAIKQHSGWTFYTGDAYYLRIETETEDHPITQLAITRADNNELRLKSLDKIRMLMRDHKEIKIFGYHDPTEFQVKEKTYAYQW
jgi:glyoxylase-like metal-dependent hydrolase (beta-lactamase superfamily II)